MIYSRIPVIGGKELDLHVLYVEVTRRGGYEKVNHFTSVLILFQYKGIQLVVYSQT